MADEVKVVRAGVTTLPSMYNRTLELGPSRLSEILDTGIDVDPQHFEVAASYYRVLALHARRASLARYREWMRVSAASDDVLSASQTTHAVAWAEGDDFLAAGTLCPHGQPIFCSVCYRL